MAEREGFEPSRGLSSPTRLAGERFRPLSHLSRLAEGVGFEPTVWNTYNSFQDYRLRPLGHPSRWFLSFCGGRGIRTLEGDKPLHAFQACALGQTMRSLHVKDLKYKFTYLLLSKKEDNITSDSCDSIFSLISTKWFSLGS